MSLEGVKAQTKVHLCSSVETNLYDITNIANCFVCVLLHCSISRTHSRCHIPPSSLNVTLGIHTQQDTGSVCYRPHQISSVTVMSVARVQVAQCSKG